MPGTAWLNIGAASLATLLTLAGVAEAKPLTVTGQVLAPPTVVNGKANVPLVVSRRAERRLHLATPLIRVVLPKRSRVTLRRPDAAGRRRAPVTTLRSGDTLKVQVKLSREIRRLARRGRSPSLAGRRAQVLRRESLYSTDELATGVLFLAREMARLSGLAQELEAIRGRLAALEATFPRSESSADLEAELAELRTEMGSLQASVASLQGSLLAASGDLATLEGTVTSLQSSTTALQGQVTSLQGTLASICAMDLITVC